MATQDPPKPKLFGELLEEAPKKKLFFASYEATMDAYDREFKAIENGRTSKPISFSFNKGNHLVNGQNHVESLGMQGACKSHAQERPSPSSGGNIATQEEKPSFSVIEFW